MTTTLPRDCLKADTLGQSLEAERRSLHTTLARPGSQPQERRPTGKKQQER